jgi:hypothetical protein
MHCCDTVIEEEEEMKRFSHLVLTLILVLTLASVSNVNSQPESTVRIFVFGPNIMATGETTEFNVTVVGGPAEEGGNFSIKAYLEGTNLTGARPLKSSPLELTSEDGKFTVNVTSPIISQKMKLFINATSSKDAASSWGETEHEIDVVKPIKLRAKIENKGSIDLKDLIVNFYVDGNFVGFENLSSLNAGASAAVTHEWLVTGLKSGRHELRATVDVNNDGTIRVEDGDIVTIQYFYKEYDDIHPAIIFAISILLIIAILLLIRTVRKKRRGW